jgi:hypothetical protein
LETRSALEAVTKIGRSPTMTSLQLRWTTVGLLAVSILDATCTLTSGEVLRIVSPLATAKVEGNQSVTPTPGPVKIQMLFPASDFAGLPETHRFLVAINFRGDRTQTEAVERIFPDKNIWISTTDSTNLSTVFADNHGPDKKLVQNGLYRFPILGTGPLEGPRGFADGVRFQKPFYYDPSQGNLLVEQSNYLPFSPNPQPVLDQQSTSEFTFLVGSNPDATSGSRVRILAVMQFEFVAPPPSDFNHNGIVDAADYTVWRDETGVQDDYEEWRANFGQTAGGDTTLLSVEPPPIVPEPSTYVLVGLMLLSLFEWRQKRVARTIHNRDT